MGTIPATTLIKNVRENLNEPIPDTDLVLSGAGAAWTNGALLEHLNKSKDRIWDIVREVRENFFMVTDYTGITLNSSTRIYDFPTDFRQLVKIKATTPGYEFIVFRKVDQTNEEFKQREKNTSSINDTNAELLYDVIDTGRLKFADFPPATLATSIDYVQYLADYTLAVNSTTEIMDEWREFLEADTTRRALSKTPTDARLPYWVDQVQKLEPKVKQSIARRDIRDKVYVEYWTP